MSTERLLSISESSKRLGISPRSFTRYKAGLIERGMQIVKAGKRVLVRESSLDRVIANAAETESPLYGGQGNG